jgi:putative membrane protein
MRFNFGIDAHAPIIAANRGGYKDRRSFPRGAFGGASSAGVQAACAGIAGSVGIKSITFGVIDMSDASTHARRGVHVPTWVFVTIGGLLLFGIAFAIGRRAERRQIDGGRFSEHAGRHGLGIFVLLVIVALVVTGIVLLVRHFSAGPHSTRDAEDVLAQRLARGEIDEADYRSRLDALRH